MLCVFSCLFMCGAYVDACHMLKNSSSAYSWNWQEVDFLWIKHCVMYVFGNTARLTGSKVHPASFSAPQMLTWSSEQRTLEDLLISGKGAPELNSVLTFRPAALDWMCSLKWFSHESLHLPVLKPEAAFKPDMTVQLGSEEGVRHTSPATSG